MIDLFLSFLYEIVHSSYLLFKSDLTEYYVIHRGVLSNQHIVAVKCWPAIQAVVIVVDVGYLESVW